MGNLCATFLSFLDQTRAQSRDHTTHNMAFECAYLALSISVVVACVAGTFAAITWTMKVPPQKGLELELRNRRARKMKHLVMALVIIMFFCTYVLFLAATSSQYSLLNKHVAFVNLVIVTLLGVICSCLYNEFDPIQTIVAVVRPYACN